MPRTEHSRGRKHGLEQLEIALTILQAMDGGYSKGQVISAIKLSYQIRRGRLPSCLNEEELDPQSLRRQINRILKDHTHEELLREIIKLRFALNADDFWPCPYRLDPRLLGKPKKPPPPDDEPYDYFEEPDAFEERDKTILLLKSLISKASQK
jgi:hypothetical protein